MVLGLPPKDYDVATSATPDEVREVFGKRRTLSIGASFGVITVLGPREAGQIEVATFRSDLNYVDGRRPEGVVYTTAEHDAQRRDFTINGLFFDPLTDQVIDYVEGRDDIAQRVVRAIGDPVARLGEDKLRMLRGVRFAARFGFDIEADTLAAIQHYAGDILQVSGERIGAEMRSMLAHPNRASAFELLNATNLSPHVLPEFHQLTDSNLQARLAAIATLNEPEMVTVLATLFAGAPSINVVALASRWKLTNREADLLGWLLAHYEIVAQATALPWPQVQRTLADERAGELLAMASALLGPADDRVAFCAARLAWPREQINPPPLVTGRQLIAAGIKPGPAMGRILDSIRDAQLLGELTSPDDAIAFARRGSA